MGDSGSMLLGMLLTIATISGVGRNPFPPSGGDLAAVVGTVMVPLLVLAIPFLDVALAVVRRTWRGKGIGQADKEHIHHRLLDIGHSHRSAVLLMYLWSALISASALAIGLIDGRLAVGAIILSAGGAVRSDGAPAAGPVARPNRAGGRRGSRTARRGERHRPFRAEPHPVLSHVLGNGPPVPRRVPNRVPRYRTGRDLRPVAVA